MTITEDGSRFNTTEETLTPDPPRLHRGAILALLLGLCSLFALLAVGWLFAAPAAVIVAIVSLRSIARSNGLYRGRLLASTGLCLGLFMLALIVTQRVYRERLLVRRSEELARQWLDLVHAGKIEQAHHLTLSKSQRVTAIPLEDYYADPDQGASFKYFQDQLEIKALRETPNPQITLLSSSRSSVLRNSEQFTHRFDVLLPGEPEKSLEVEVVTERTREANGAWHWRIVSSSGKLRRNR